MAGPTTDSKGQIVRRQEASPADKLAVLIQRMSPEIARALPKHVSADRMARIALTAIRQTPQLGGCDQGSFLGALLSASALGLECNTPLAHAYLLPYGGKVQLIIGYQGMIELARRSGLVTNLYAYAVREGDSFSYQLGLRPDLHHVPSTEPGRPQRPLTHVYAVAHVKGGDPIFVVLSREEVD